MTILGDCKLGTRHLGHRIVRFDAVSSTNDVALEFAAEPGGIGTAVLADEQTAGRGRMGRAWICPPRTALQLSFTVDPPPVIRRPVVLTAWASSAVADMAHSVLQLPVSIKWPNDVVVFGKKIAGILIEQKSAVVVGIGLNVSQTVPELAGAGLFEAASLATLTGRTFDRDELACDLLRRLDESYAALIENRFDEIESNWSAAIGLVGREVTLEKRDGSAVVGRLQRLSFDEVIIQQQNEAPMSVAPEWIRHIRLLQNRDL